MTKSKRQGWRRILVALVVGVVVISLVTAAIFLLTWSSSDSSGTKTASGLTLEEWLGGSLTTKSFNGTWLSGK